MTTAQTVFMVLSGTVTMLTFVLVAFVWYRQNWMLRLVAEVQGELRRSTPEQLAKAVRELREQLGLLSTLLDASSVHDLQAKLANHQRTLEERASEMRDIQTAWKGCASMLEDFQVRLERVEALTESRP